MAMTNTLLLVADFINDIVHPDGAFGKYNAQRVIDDNTLENTNKVIAFARDSKHLIAHVRVGFDSEYTNCPKNSPMFSKSPEKDILKIGTWGLEFHESIDVKPHDRIITKHRVSALYGTNLEPLMRANNIQNILMCGVSTTYVVESTARELHDRDYNVTVVSDACNAASKQQHDSSINALARFCDIKTTDELVQKLN